MPGGTARFRWWARLAVLLSNAAFTAISLRAQPGAAAIAVPAAPVLEANSSGEAIYQAACTTCHGADGRGAPRTSVGFETPLPDFTDCPTSTPEPDVQWRAIITNGGPARAFSQIMPSFKDLLTPEQIVKVVDHLRSLCTENTWPRGDLNLPRAMITEKAFPENETVVTGAINARGTPGIASAAMLARDGSSLTSAALGTLATSGLVQIRPFAA